jgi:hypothetical protein
VQARNIDEVLILLDRVIADYRGRRNRLAFFAALYRAVTLRVQAGIRRGEFADGERMDRFDTAFANRYLAALDAWNAGRKPARAWQVAFQTESRPGTIILQHLLLGMNAHINFDLPIAALTVAPGAQLPGIQADFMAINTILEALLDPVQAAVNRLSPLLHVLDHVGGRSDEGLVNFSISNARDEAWHEAKRLARDDADDLERSVLSLDRRVALLGQRIFVPGGACGLAIDLISRTESADVHAVTDALLAVE